MGKIINKKMFRQLIVGKLIDHISICEIFDKKHSEEIKRAQQVAQEIIEFAENNNMFSKDIE